MSDPRSSSASPKGAVGASVLDGPGEVRELMRARAWEKTPLGPPEVWPASLKAIVRVMLTSRFAMWMAWGSELTFLCNDAYLPTVGLKRDWVIGSRSDLVWAEIWPEIGPRVPACWPPARPPGTKPCSSTWNAPAFLEESYHTFSYSPLPNEAGETSGMLCVVAEVTERVIGERQLATLRDLGSRLSAASTRVEVMRALEACLEAEPRDAPFALAYLVDDGDLILCASHGVTRGGAAAPERFDPADHDWPWPLTEASAAAVIVDVSQGYVSELRLDHWQSPPNKALIAPLVGADGGAPLGYLVSGLNPHRKLDADYRGFIELLAAQVSAAIARADQYDRARERAETLAELDRAKTAFFSNVSHEFRTPLTLMLGPLEELMGSPEAAVDPDARKMAEVAHRNGLRLLRLVNALLDFSRIEAGRARATFRPTDLAALTTDLASTFRSATDRAGLRLEVDCKPLKTPAFVDREMWEKIVLNLLSNAFKFTLEGRITVELCEVGGRARLAVRDTGVGIPETELPRLFERFHRVAGAKGRSFEGSGIGLALVQELVKLHGGSIAVSSTVGEGTIFTIELPLGAEHLPSGSDSGRARDGGAARRRRSLRRRSAALAPGLWNSIVTDEAPPNIPADGAGRTVLVADDNADLRLYMGRLLRDRGYVVQTAQDGEAALEAARANRPDLLVTDVMMPRLDGFGLLSAVRADPDLRELPVIMLSARSGEDAKVEGLDAGADDYLTKPFSARELLSRVAANLSLAKLRREAIEVLTQSEARLKERVAEEIAARADAEDALRQAQKMEAVGQLTGGIAHDFNNLLTIVLGNVDMARRALTSGNVTRASRAIENAQSGAERAASLTHRLLAFSRRQPLDPKPTDISKLVDDMADLLHRALGETVEVEIVTGARSLAGGDRPQSARERAYQSLDQRPRRHAPGRKADDRHEEPRLRRRRGRRRLRGRLGDRHR